jgi:hypothetical protein
MFNGFGPNVDSARYWSRLLCSHCGSAYEIKSAKREKDILFLRKNGIMSGGIFFSQYYAVKNRQPKDAKMFVSICSYKPKDSNSTSVWPVYVAEIEDIIPTLRERSFESNKEHKIYSRMVLNKQSFKPWFDAPCFDYDATSIASGVIGEHT